MIHSPGLPSLTSSTERQPLLPHDLLSFHVKNCARSFSFNHIHFPLSQTNDFPLTPACFTIHHTNLDFAFDDDDEEDFVSFFSASRPLRPDFSSPSFFDVEETLPFFLDEAGVAVSELISSSRSLVSPTRTTRLTDCSFLAMLSSASDNRTPLPPFASLPRDERLPFDPISEAVAEAGPGADADGGVDDVLVSDAVAAITETS